MSFLFCFGFSSQKRAVFMKLGVCFFLINRGADYTLFHDLFSSYNNNTHTNCRREFFKKTIEPKEVMTRDLIND